MTASSTDGLVIYLSLSSFSQPLPSFSIDIEIAVLILYTQEIHGSLRKQASILQKAAMKISAQSEQHGCYQQV